MSKQFSDVSSKYGAPMGRSATPQNRPDVAAPERRMRLYRVRLNSGGYDDGGAYWGTGAPLWCAEDTAIEYREFTRAANRAAAAAALGIEKHLIQGVRHARR